MSAASRPPNEVAIPLPPRPSNRRRRAMVNRGFAAICWMVASLSVVILSILVVSLVSQAIPYLTWTTEDEYQALQDQRELDGIAPVLNEAEFADSDWRERWEAEYDAKSVAGKIGHAGHRVKAFITGEPSRRPATAGLGPAMWGSIWICAICAFVALPLGVGTAIFLEEYKPTKPIICKLHGFIQLNISNLAGVPSIVYGIIGLTVFVQMFGLLGQPSDPGLVFGATYQDEFVDERGEYLTIEVGRGDPLTVIREGMTLFDDDGNAVIVTLVDPETWDYPEPETVAGGTLLANVEPNRTDTRHWYYMQLPFGRGVLAGALTLMLVILPVVIISSQEALRAVPTSLREGSLGLGATRWQTIRRMTLPTAVPGVMTGAILAMSRAIGEAAPILILAGIVYITFAPEHLMDQFTAMPLQIYDWAGRPQEDFHRVAAMGIVVLLSILLTFNTVAVLIRQKFQKSTS